MKDAKYYGEKAKELFLSGYNCSQSVVGAFSDIIEIDEKLLLHMASGFGGGMGRLRETCGCVSGMVMVLGYLYGYDDPKVYDGKKILYEKVQTVAGRFKDENGSLICRELLGIEGKDSSHVPSKRTDEHYRKRPCAQMAACAAEILAEFIIDQNK